MHACEAKMCTDSPSFEANVLSFPVRRLNGKVFSSAWSEFKFDFSNLEVRTKWALLRLGKLIRLGYTDKTGVSRAASSGRPSASLQPSAALTEPSQNCWQVIAEFLPQGGLDSQAVGSILDE